MGFSPTSRVIQIPEAYEVGELPSPVGNDFHSQSSMWNDLTFNSIKLIGTLLPFHEDLSSGYKAIYTKAPLKLFDLKENHFLMVLLMEQVDQEKNAHIKSELKSKFSDSQGNLAKCQAIVKTLKKEKEKEAVKLKPLWVERIPS